MAYPWVCYQLSKQCASWKEVSWAELRDTEKGESLRIALSPVFFPGHEFWERTFWNHYSEDKRPRVLGLMSTAELQADFNGHRWF